ncbi:MAG TPA: phosphotransferase [Phycisphaerae bacterium]|nr:phosphotransferase [Phycisphaerae bacterium]
MPSRLRADFQPHELSAVLRRFTLGNIVRVDKQLKGSRRSPKAIITTDKGRFLLKRRARGKDHPLKVAYAHAVQEYLSGKGFPVPRLIPVKDGDDTMVLFSDLIYEMFEYVPGESYRGLPEETEDGGRVLAQFHKLLFGYESEWEPSRLGYHDNNGVRSNLNGIPAAIGKDDSVAGKEGELLATVGALFDAYEVASDEVNEAGYPDWPCQIVHADWHPGNMLFRDGAVAAVIDYDSLHLMPTVTDLANGALQFSIIGGPVDPREWPPELDEDRYTAFLRGYQEEDGAVEEQIPALPSLMIEALIAEAVMPIAATGSFGRIEGFRFMQMILRKVRWLRDHSDRLVQLWRA